MLASCTSQDMLASPGEESQYGVKAGALTGVAAVSSSPSNNAIDVPTRTNASNNVVTGTVVTVTFSEPMNPATLNSSPAGTLLTFTLKETTGNDVPGTVALNAANTVAKTMIAMNTGATANGRLLAQTAVTLQKNAVTQPAP